jgi:hypothetical protein
MNAMHKVQRVVCYMIMSNLTTLTSMSYLLIYLYPFLYFSNLTTAQKINNMHYTYLILLFDFLQVLYGAREFPTKN